jgi:hypothetical protein
MILDPANFIDRYVEQFNAADVEDIINLVPNARAAAWMRDNVPMFSCPDATIERVFAFRWWIFRKHLKSTPAGTIVTEFIEPVRHAGMYNSISCALGFHLAEGRWIADASYLDDYTRFWFIADAGKPEPRFHRYSSWLAHAALQRERVDGSCALLDALCDDLITDYARWEEEKQLCSGAFYQFDVWDGMEESITGSRTARNIRPTINSYMFANALALAELCDRRGDTDRAASFRTTAASLKAIVQTQLWDAAATFFKVRLEDHSLSDAREAIGFVPWMFDLPDLSFDVAWDHLIDPEAFWAPRGLTTAERRHLLFRSHGVGKCEWDGAVWPFATSQTLYGLANVLRRDATNHNVTRHHYLHALTTYAAAHTRDGADYIGEYHDELTGQWLKGDHPRGRYYNHSSFCDLVISHLVGLVPSPRSEFSLRSLLPDNAWPWFCLDRVRYHGSWLTILWDRDGSHFRRGAGLNVFLDGRLHASRDSLAPCTISLEEPS